MRGIYSNLCSEMARRGITIDEIASVLCLHRNSAANKINGRTPFSVEEAFLLRDAKFPGMEVGYLFRRFPTEENEEKESA